MNNPGFKPWLFLLLAFIIQTGLTRTFNDWWFEDDVYQRHFIKSCPEPAVYFTDNDRSYSFNMGRTFTPLLAFTLYTDYLISPAPTAAYLHTSLVLAITLCLLYALLSPYLGWRGATYVCSLGLFLPSTLVITEFIATRHYLEGLALSLGALLIAVRYPFSSKARNGLALLSIALLFYLAALAKEVYVTFTFYSLAGILFYRRKWFALLILFLSGGAYAAHRLWFLKGVSRDSFPFHFGLLKDFQSLPFVLTGNEAGYIATALILGLLVAAVYKKHLWGFKLLWTIGALVVLLGSILPVYKHLHVGHDDLGTWYRLVFLVNLFTLALAVWMAAKLLPKPVNLALGLGCFLMVLPTSWQTAKKWDHLKAVYETEARFYLDHPNRLLYTELPAPWFIGNVQDLYGGDAMPHYIDREALLDRGVITQLLEDHQEIWRGTPNGYAPDPQLLESLKTKNQAMEKPFTAAVDF